MERLHHDPADDAAERLGTGARGREAAAPRGARPNPVDSVTHLQRLAGNRAVAGLLGGLRTGGGARRTGPTHRHAALGDEGGAVTESTEEESTEGGGDATQLGATTTQSVPTSSFTKVGPPTKSSYTVSGTLRQAADAVAARPEAGATKTTPDLNSADNGTKMTQAQVTVTQEVELPTWSDRGTATANQQAEWDRFLKAITAHEDGHVAVDVKSFAGAHSKILAKPTIADANTEFDRITTQATTDNDTYDTGNDHGRNAGTKINPNIDEVTKVP